MAGLTYHCEECGAAFGSPAIVIGGGQGFFENISVICKCGGKARLPSGDYEIENYQVKRFVAATPEDLALFQRVAEDLNAGKIDGITAAAEASAISPQFAKWLTIFQVLGGLGTLIGLIQIYLAVTDRIDGDKDNEKLLAELQRGRAVNEQILEVSREMLETLRSAPPAISAAPELKETPQRETGAPPQTRPEVIPLSPSRHARRQAAALARAQKRTRT